MEGQSWRVRKGRWALVHPWRFAIVGGVLAWLFVVMIGVSQVLALGIGAAWYIICGWSMSRGPGRRLTERRIASRNAESN